MSDSKRKYAEYDETLIRKLHEEGMSNVDIAKQIGCVKSTITYILKKQGVGNSMKDIMTNKDEVYRLHSEGYSNNEIANIMDKDRSNIYDIIKNAGLVANKSKTPKPGSFTTSKEELEEMLKTMKIPEIANKLQKSVQCIYTKIKEFGITR